MHNNRIKADADKLGGATRQGSWRRVCKKNGPVKNFV
jgi:hypothetical protein